MNFSAQTKMDPPPQVECVSNVFTITSNLDRISLNKINSLRFEASLTDAQKMKMETIDWFVDGVKQSSSNEILSISLSPNKMNPIDIQANLNFKEKTCQAASSKLSLSVVDNSCPHNFSINLLPSVDKLYLNENNPVTFRTSLTDTQKNSVQRVEWFVNGVNQNKSSFEEVLIINPSNLSPIAVDLRVFYKNNFCSAQTITTSLNIIDTSCPNNLPLISSTGQTIALGGYTSSYNSATRTCSCNNGLKTRRSDDSNADGIKDGTTNTPAVGTPNACIQSCKPGAGPNPEDLPTIDARTGQFGCYGCKKYEVNGNVTDGIYMDGKCHYCNSSKWIKTAGYPSNNYSTFTSVNGYYCVDSNCRSRGLVGSVEHSASMEKLDLYLYNCNTRTTFCGQSDATLNFQRRYASGDTISEYKNYGCSGADQIRTYRLSCNRVSPLNLIYLHSCQESSICTGNDCDFNSPGPGGGFPGGGGVWSP